MKRILSLILAAAMVLALVPSVFAEVGHTITYNFNCKVLGSSETIETVNATGILAKTTGTYKTAGWKLLRSGRYNTANFDGNTLKLVTEKNVNADTAALFEIAVDESGIYEVAVTFLHDATRGSYLETYFFDESTVTEKSLDVTLNAAENTLSDLTTSGLTALDETYIDTTASIPDSTYTYTNKVTLNANEKNYLMFAIPGYNKTAATGVTSSKSAKAAVSSVTLTKVDDLPVEEEPVEEVKESYVFNGNAVDEAVTDGYKVISGLKPADGYDEWSYYNDAISTKAVYPNFLQLTGADNVENSYLTLKITVDESAVYKPTLNYRYRKRYGYLKTYIISPKALEASGMQLRNAAGMAAVCEAFTPLDNLGLQMYKDANLDSQDNASHNYNEELALEAGEYYLVFYLYASQAELAQTEKAQAQIYDFTLKKVDDYVPAEDDSEAAEESLYIWATNNIETGILPDETPYARGASVTVSTPETKTVDEVEYEFRHWVRGSADKGTWVSDKADYTFTILTNTYLTAVYAPKADAEKKIVQFYNGNGQYLSSSDVNSEDKLDALPAAPDLTGFKFSKWLLSENNPLTPDTVLTAKVTRAVAEFEDDNTTTFKVVKPGETEATASSYIYDTEIELTSPKAVVWERDGKPVAYGTSYKFNVWGNTTITTSALSLDAEPIVMLDPEEKANGARMIEYDAAGKEIIEVGILFGDGTNMAIDSAMQKATSQRKAAHGQFTAKGDYANAIGYLVYRDGANIRIIYSK